MSLSKIYRTNMNNEDINQKSQEIKTDSSVFEKKNPQISQYDIESLSKEFKLLKKQTENLKKDFLVFIGIFVAFITYISVEIKVLQNASDIFTLVGLSSFFLSSVLLFAFFLNNLVKEKDRFHILISPTFMLIAFFLLISFYCFYQHFQLINNSVSLFP